ncbi:MAG: hypothetical protein U0Z44_21275 [Kouleothrix sp.]
MAHRPRSMRWRIASAYIALLLGTLALLALVLFQLLRTTYVRTLEAGLAGQARLVAMVADERAAATPADALAATARELHTLLDARVTLIAADGAVLADSLQTPAASGNLLDRPEVRDAMALGQGTSERISVATGDDMLYVAIPTGPRGALHGVARVGVPLTIAQAQARLAAAVLLAAAGGAARACARSPDRPAHHPAATRAARHGRARLAGGDLEARS